jgi:cation diffusion facilitator family transporter
MLKKIFIKNYKNVNDATVRGKYGVVASFFGIITNFIICVFKIVAGFISGSITIIADGVNNLTDAGSSVLTLIGFKLSLRPADKEHPYGHERYEQVTALIVSLVMFAIGITFFYSCIEKIINKEGINGVTLFTYLVLIFSIVLKLVQMLVYLDFAKAIKSLSLKATAIDTRNDIISTATTLLAIILIDVYGINVDAYAGLVVSSFILYTGLKMLKETISPLLGVIPEKEEVDKLKSLVLKDSRILGVHDIIIHEYGKTVHFASLHAEVDCCENFTEIHDLIDNIEREVYNEMNIKLSIHLDPIDINNKDRQKYLTMVEKVLTSYDSNVKFHDFRIVDGVTHVNIIFDLVIPFDKKYDMQEILKLLDEEFSPLGKFYFVIESEPEYI